jgi:2'-hydroxyisoflavone reductase
VSFRWLALDGPAGLVAQGLRPWVDLPLVVPQESEWRSFMRARNDRAVAAGLKTRPLAETVADTLAWHRSLAPAEQAFTLAGLTPQREAELLRTAGPPA